MRIVQDYVARQIVRTAAVILAVMICAFVLERTLRLLRDVDPAHLPLGTATAMLAWKLPEILAIALPMAFFAGILLTFQRLARDNELVVLRSMGAGLWSVMRPLALLAASVAALFAMTAWFLLPHGRYHYSILAQAAEHDLLAAPLRMGSFIQLGDNVLHVQPRADGSGRPDTLFLHETAGGGPARVTTAVVEDFAISADRGTLAMSLRAGQRLTLPDSRGRTTLLSFEHAREMIHVGAVRLPDPRGADAAELTLPELLAASVLPVRPPIDAQIHAKLARVLLILILPLAAVPLALLFPARRHWMGIVAGAAAVVGVDQALIFGEALVAHGEATAWAAIWAPLATFAAASGILCAATRIGDRRR